MIKVVEAISDTNIGGAGVLLINRLKHTDNAIFDTTVVLPQGSDLIPMLNGIGVKVVCTKYCRDKSFDLGGVREYIGILKDLRPDIINAHGCLSARVAARFSRVPLRLYTRHCVYPVGRIYKSSVVRYAFGAFSNALSDRTIAVAYSASKNLTDMGMEKGKICVVINGAEPIRELSDDERKSFRKSLAISKEDFVVLICARLEKCKDHETFLRAAAILLEDSCRYKFIILGSGSQENSLKAMCRDLKINDYVIFAGFAHDIAPYMNVCDLNVNCSVGTETSSLALSEGMSIGKACVASDYGGNPYMVNDGVNGYLYRAGDCEDLALKIKLVAAFKKNDPSKYESLCAESKKRYESELNSLAMSNKIQRLYIELLEAKKERPR